MFHFALLLLLTTTSASAQLATSPASLKSSTTATMQDTSPPRTPLSASPLAAAGVKALTPEDQAQGIWIDVRTPAEFSLGHLQGAINVPLDVLVQHIERVVPDRSAYVRLSCRSGNRSGMALQLLRQMGYTNATNEGGYAYLKARGAQVVEP